MDKEHEEMIQYLTARYVADYHAGRQPQLSEYLLRYPQYAGMLLDFVTYFHAMEIDLPPESEFIAPLTHMSRAAYNEAMEKVEYAGFELSSKPDSLRVAADNAQKSLFQVSLEVGLGQDILYQLDQHRINMATIPREASRRLAKALHQPVSDLEMLLGLDRPDTRLQLVAEQPSGYHVDAVSAQPMHTTSFQEAIEQSERMSEEQKADWRAVLSQEGLL